MVVLSPQLQVIGDLCKCMQSGGGGVARFTLPASNKISFFVVASSAVACRIPPLQCTVSLQYAKSQGHNHP